MMDARRHAGARRGLSLGSGAAAALAALALALPAAADAHTGTAAVSCTGADFAFKLFARGANTVHFDVAVDGVSVAHGDQLLDQNGGREGAVHVPLALTGDHVVRANAWWGPAGVADHNTRPESAPALADKKLSCPPPPPPPPPPPVVPSVPVAPAPAPAPAAAPAPVAAPAPASDVAGVISTSPSRAARVAVATRCASRTARVTVTGRSMRDVTLSVNGKRVRTVRVGAAATRVTVSVPIAQGRAQTVTARVRFRNGAAPRTLVHRAVRCAAAAVQPQFTG